MTHPDARCSTRGPCAAVRWDDRPRSGSRQEVGSFSTAQGCAVEKPGSGSRTCRAGMPGKRQVGWPSLLVTYLLLRASCPPPFGPAALFAPVPDGRVATQEISNSRAEGARKPLIYASSGDYGLGGSVPLVRL